jgi:hypothetical protein
MRRSPHHYSGGDQAGEPEGAPPWGTTAAGAAITPAGSPVALY